jgi:hypothetical protein
VTKWGKRGSENGMLYYPLANIVDPFNPKIFVADTHNHRIQVFVWKNQNKLSDLYVSCCLSCLSQE